MTFFRSELTMLLIFSSAVLMLAGTASKKGNVLSFFGAVCCAAGVVAGLVEGAQLSEALLYVLLILLISCTGDYLRRRKKG